MKKKVLSVPPAIFILAQAIIPHLFFVHIAAEDLSPGEAETIEKRSARHLSKHRQSSYSPTHMVDADASWAACNCASVAASFSSAA